MNLFDDAKAKALKAVDKDIAKYSAKNGKPYSSDLEARDKISKINKFPGDCVVLADAMAERINLHHLDVKYKAIFLKAHLKSVFPNADIKVRIDRFSMGSAIDAWIVGDNIDEALASKIGHLYSEDMGRSDPQTDYFAYDNYVHVMCKNGGLMNSCVAIIGKNMPGTSKDDAIKSLMSS